MTEFEHQLSSLVEDAVNTLNSDRRAIVRALVSSAVAWAEDLNEVSEAINEALAEPYVRLS